MGKIIVVGLGPGARELLTVGAYEHLTGDLQVFLRTEKHPVVDKLKEQGLTYKSFDYLYETCEQFEHVYEQIVENLLIEAKQHKKIVYAVPGHPLVAEDAVAKLLKVREESSLEVDIVTGMSFLDVLYSRLKIDPVKGIDISDGLSLKAENINPIKGQIICQIYNSRAASEVKLTLMEVYPDEHEITVVRGAGIPEIEEIQEIKLFELDRLTWIDYLTSIYVPPMSIGRSQKCNNPLDPIVDVMETLRGENGCPWDKKQSHESLKKYLIEETYEVIDAIDEKNMYKICDELGDLLLQIVFHSQIASESHSFDINDVVQAITEKMIRRHPHVFGNVVAETSEQVVKNWDEIKRSEKQAGEKTSLLEVPSGLPALQKSEKLQAKAAKVGFDWPNIDGVWAKIQEEIIELKEVMPNEEKRDELKDELGDVLFGFCNLARWYKIDPEDALRQTCNKFIRRFNFILDEVEEKGLILEDMNLDQLNIFWEKAKEYEKK